LPCEALYKFASSSAADMSSHVVVLDTSLRRATVKVNPGTYMTEILEEACKKWGLKSSNYGLKYDLSPAIGSCLTYCRNNNKPIDLSRTFRQTGLVSGAKLELVLASKSPSVVSVALQVPETLGVPGERLTDKFPSDTTLWLILRKFESSEGRNLNFTGRGVTTMESGASGAGRVFYEMPVPNVMGRELSTFGDLQKTLAQLGVNGGSILIRLNFKKTEQPLEEAMVEIGQYFKEEAKAQAVDAKGDATTASGATVTNDLEKLPPHSEDKDVDMQDATQGTSKEPAASHPQATALSGAPSQVVEAPAASAKALLGPNDRPIEVYAAPSSDTPKAALAPHNESDYEISIALAKQHQAHLQNNTQNKRLPSDAELEELEREREAKLSATKQVTLKIRFPDQSSIVSTFTADDTSAQLYHYTTNVLASPDQPFKLVYNEGKGPQTIPRDETKKLIRHLGFKGQVLLNFVWEDAASAEARKGPVLKSQYAQKARAVTVPELAAAPAVKEEQPSLDKGKEKETSGSGDGKPKGMPKWLKLGKK
jgi:tether containing UBX domain for GLUT4